MCADQPATREQANIAGTSAGGISAIKALRRYPPPAVLRPDADGTLLFGNLNDRAPRTKNSPAVDRRWPLRNRQRLLYRCALSVFFSFPIAECANNLSPSRKPRGFAKATVVGLSSSEARRRVDDGDKAVAETRAARREFWNFRRKRKFAVFWNTVHTKSPSFPGLPAGAM